MSRDGRVPSQPMPPISVKARWYRFNTPVFVESSGGLTAEGLRTGKGNRNRETERKGKREREREINKDTEREKGEHIGQNDAVGTGVIIKRLW